jgi:1-acyl-sn-glycerol-3-phosphate acyltransferase
VRKQQYNLLAEIAGRVWAIWALIFFLSTMIIAFIFYVPCYLMKEPRAARWHRSVSRVWMTLYLNLIGCPLRVSGNEHFVKGQNYVVVCNHNSFMDVPVTTPFMPNANKTIAKKEFARIPIFGWIYSLGAVLVDRKSNESRKRSYDRMKAILRLGLDMVIYPEGTRNKSNQPMGVFHDGAFRLAKDCDKPIMPAVIFNTRKVLPAAKPFFVLPHILSMHFLPPVSPDGLSIPELKETVFQQMWSYYEKNENDL